MSTAHPPCLIPRGAARLLAVTLQRDARHRGVDTHRVLAAMLLACQVHRGQQRSADGQPYVVHPLQVALLVGRWGGSTDDVLAAVLHDTAEDGAAGPRATLNHIADLFGRPVALRVAALTKNRAIADAEARAADHARRITEACTGLGPGVAAIRLADRLHNVVTSGHYDADRLLRLHAQTVKHVQPLAERLQLPALSRFLGDGPARWHAVSVSRFVPGMLQIQPPWVGEAGERAAAALAASRWPRLRLEF